uniref:SH3-containing GRB2-like protein 3-interacting protein 1 n=1 Tax=Oncorhynchus mykiss TaxID=8022 RepID=A0A8C7NJG8_ONCMY
MTFSIETIAVLNGDPPGPKPPKEHFFSSSESEGEEDHRKKFKIKIKPLPAESANCLAPSVDELRASIGNIALSPSPLVSTSPRLHCSVLTGVMIRTIELFSRMCLNCCICLTVLLLIREVLSTAHNTFLSVYVFLWFSVSLHVVYVSFLLITKCICLSGKNDQPSLVWFDRGKFYLTFEGCSRGPSPLTMGAQDTLPVAAAFTETVNAFFKGANPNKCVVKITGEMVLSFPAGITRHFANNPSPAVLTFSITHYSWLEHVLPNPQLLCCDTATTPNPDCKTFWVNMPNLITHLKKVAEQKPQATYYNVDMLKYQVSARGLTSTPLNLAASWRCEPTSTDLRIDYKYNGGSMTTPVALNNVQFLIPVDGGVTKLLAVLPPAAWNAEQQRILWKIPDISQKSENGGIGSLLARFQLSEGPSKPSPLAVQFTSEGSTLSGCDIELAGPGYRFSLIKKRFAAGKYLADN